MLEFLALEDGLDDEVDALEVGGVGGRRDAGQQLGRGRRERAPAPVLGGREQVPEEAEGGVGDEPPAVLLKPLLFLSRWTVGGEGWVGGGGGVGGVVVVEAARWRGFVACAPP